MAAPAKVTPRPWAAAGIGLVVLACGAWLSKTCVLDVLDDAEHHLPVSLSVKGVFLAPTLILVGLVCLVVPLFGERVWQPPANPTSKRRNVLGYAIGVLLLAPGAALVFWLRAQLMALGYDV